MAALTVSLPHEPQDAREYDRMVSRQRMLDRAARLREDGYTILPVTRTSNAYVTRPVLGRFLVVNPRGAVYAIDMFNQTCECTCWRRMGECKHLRGAYRLAMQQAVTRRRELWPVRYDRRFCAAYEAEDLLFRAMMAAKDAVDARRAA